MTPEILELPPSTTAVIDGVIDAGELAAFFDRSFATVPHVIASQNVAIAGPAFARYHRPPAETFDLEVGFPTDRRVEPDGDVRPGALPGGRVVRAVHEGAYDELGAAWEQIGRWIFDQGLAPTGDLWEVYVTQPSPDMDPAELRTELYWAVAD